MNGDQPNPTNQDQSAPAAPAPSGVNQKPIVVEKIKGASSILVAVSANPSIDQLAAAIALTLLLEKYKKNATAVFSGKIPSALEFLKPNDTFQKNTDSMRDFIIAIDKSKADKLRYKVEDNVVKIFITPYKTSITEKDLQYNAGDFNVDVIVALGVQHQADLDTAISAHGRIFHDAVVVSINNVSGGDFGIANWEDQGASSLSELVANLSNELGADMLDADISTALLTGIVAETSRFSNEKTHPETMTLSSRLLQAGADQQLVNQQLQSVISTDVTLQAGTEIKPTMSADQLEEITQPAEEEELVIGKDGSLAPADDAEAGEDDKSDKSDTPEAVSDAGSASEPKPAETTESSDKPEGETPAEPTPQTEDKPTEPTPESSPETDSEDTAAKESKKGTKKDAKLEEPDLDLSALAAESPEAATPDPAEDPDDAEAARKAVTDALKNAAAEADAVPAINVVEAPVEEAPAETPVATSEAPAADATPLTQPGPGPNAVSTNTVPPIGSEPAPLAMSPADQAFTMPMPPSSSMAQASPIAMAPGNPAPDAAAAPPPLPPPIMPPPVPPAPAK